VVKVWDLASGTMLRDLHGHTDFIYSLAFSNDSALLASGQSLWYNDTPFLHGGWDLLVNATRSIQLAISVTSSEDQFMILNLKVL